MLMEKLKHFKYEYYLVSRAHTHHFEINYDKVQLCSISIPTQGVPNLHHIKFLGAMLFLSIYILWSFDKQIVSMILTIRTHTF